MRRARLIVRMDIKGENLIKGIQLEGLRVIGPAYEYAFKYYLQGADEIIYMDSVASLFGRNSLSEIIKSTAKNVFVPITVGGGIRTLYDASNILRSGADKIAINTAAINNPKIISDIASQFGSQCMVLSIEAKKIDDGWEAYTNNGREKSGKDVLEWAKRGVEMGAGEILLTSIDREGTRSGFDLDLIRAVSKVVNVPLIASGGMGKPEDAISAFEVGVDAIAIADLFHYQRYSIKQIREAIKQAGVGVRNFKNE